MSLSGMVSFFRLGQLRGTEEDVEFLKWVVEHGTDFDLAMRLLPSFLKREKG
jgi:hypothetical protein